MQPRAINPQPLQQYPQTYGEIDLVTWRDPEGELVPL